MKPKLARILVERGVIHSGSFIEAYYNTKGISCQTDAFVLGSFMVTGAKATKDWVYFEAHLPDDAKACYRIRCDQLVSLDGMPSDRVAESQHLNEDGEKLKTRRRNKSEEDLEDEYVETH